MFRILSRNIYAFILDVNRNVLDSINLSVHVCVYNMHVRSQVVL